MILVNNNLDYCLNIFTYLGAIFSTRYHRFIIRNLCQLSQLTLYMKRENLPNGIVEVEELKEKSMKS